MNIWRLMAHHEPEHLHQTIRWIRMDGVIAIGWATGDLRHLNGGLRNAKDVTKVVTAAHPENTVNNWVNGGHSLWNFYREMKLGDLVIISDGLRVLTVRATGDYYYVPDEYPRYEHRRRVEAVAVDPNWLWQYAGGMAPGENVRRTLIRCARPISDRDFRKAVG